MAKPTIVQDVFTVKRKHFITPNFIRITLTGNVTIFKDATLGDNNKIFIPPKGISKVHMRTYDPIKEQIVFTSKRGINLSDSLELAGCVRALKKALKQARKRSPQVYHSDREIQYCSNLYTNILIKK